MSNPDESQPRSINDTAEVPVVVQDAPPQQAVPPPKKKGKGCLVGCLIFVVLSAALLIAAAIFLKNAWDEVWNGDDTTTTTVSAGPAREVGVEEYQGIVSGHLLSLRSKVETAGNGCQDVNQVATCRTDVRALRDELVATQTDLEDVRAPSAFTKSDAEFRAALSEAIKGTDDVDAGLGGNPIRLARGLVAVSKAGTKLSSAGAQLTKDANAAAANAA